jgi:SAM-dependent methyltransferase
MKQENYHTIIEHYEACLAKHGPCLKGMDWPNDHDALKRYAVMADVIRDKDAKISLLDLGCGAAFFVDYLTMRSELHVDYCGIDASAKMIEAAGRRHPGGQFEVRDILRDPLPEQSVDYIIMNGVLTEKVVLTYHEMEIYAQALIASAYSTCKKGLAFNVMSTHVDWERDDLFHWPVEEALTFIRGKCSRNVAVRMDYGLYEYTIYIYRDSI